MDNPKRKLRISVVEPSGLLYGSELSLLDILEGLDPTRFDPEVILPREAPLSARLRSSGIAYRELLPPIAPRESRVRRVLAYATLARHWSRHRPDLIYVNQGGILRPVAWIASRLRLPLVCQVQTLEDARWVSGLGSIHHQVMAFICNSRFIAAQTKVPADRLCTLYQGYKPKGLPATRRMGKKQPLEVGVLGRICEAKGHDLVIEAAARLREKNCSDYHFRFIGDAVTPAERQRYEDIVHSRDLGGLIEFRGYRADIGNELSQLDLLAIPSLAEPLGRIYFEASEARLPVLASDGGGLGEVAGWFGAGRLFASGNIEDFLEKLDALHVDYENSTREFDAAAARMLAALDLGAYLRVMEEILARTAAARPVADNWFGVDGD